MRKTASRLIGSVRDSSRPVDGSTLMKSLTQARSEAEASFEHIMKTLEELADAGQRVPTARRDELYRNTNDAFAALSAALDPNDAADMQALEDANIRMKAMLHELGVRVPRRPPVAEQ